LLAKKVLEGKTKGYKNHPELNKFKSFKEPLLAINSYLYYVYLEAKKRNYKFKLEKIDTSKIISRAIPINIEQMEFEFSHLCNKLKIRDKKQFNLVCKTENSYIECNPVFYLLSKKK